jgi:L-lactate utilization protein LutB
MSEEGVRKSKQPVKTNDLKEIKEIISEIDQILERHEKFMTIKGANVYFAMRFLKKAKNYLKDELEILEKLSQ